MDSSADPHAFDDKKPEAASEGAAGTGADPTGESTSQALTPFEAKAPTDPERKEPPPLPKAEPIPSSALVVIPPKKEKFSGGFSAGEPLGGHAGQKRPSWAGYALRAAAIVLVAGGAYALGSRYLSLPGLATPNPVHTGTPVAALVSPPAAAPALPASAAAPESAPPLVAPNSDLAELRRDASSLSSDVHKLQARLAALQAQTPDEIRDLKKSVDGLKADLEAARADSKAQIAALSARLDHVHESAARVSAAEKPHPARLDAKAIQATLDRAARGDTDTTGSLPGSADSAHATPATLASAEAPHHPPQLLGDWIVRDVYRGIALVEGPQGEVEVMPGDVLPGAGTVRAIQRRGDGWIVLTSRGYVDYDHD